MVERSGTTVFIPKIYGPVIPTRYEITVNYMSEIFGYLIDIDMDLTYAANMCKQKHRVHIQARYGYANQWYGAPYSIRFTPNPVLKAQYGKYFNKLRNHRLVIINKHGHEDLIVTPTTMPPSCLLLVSVNVAKHEIPSNISAILMNSDVKLSGSSFRDVSTQTIEDEDLNDYANLLHEVTSRIWGYHNTLESKFPLFDEYFKNSVPYTNKKFPEYPIGVNDTDEYDIEFPEFNNGKSVYRGNKRETISENSIPKPISSVQIQNSKFKPRTEKLKDQITLPNFEDAFLNQELVGPMYEVSLKRKRGRPKLVRAKSYSTATKCENMSYHTEEYCSSSENPPCEGSNTILNSSDTKHETSDSSFTRLNSIFEQSKEVNVTDQVKDINFELDIIDQLIKEDSEKNILQNH